MEPQPLLKMCGRLSDTLFEGTRMADHGEAWQRKETFTPEGTFARGGMSPSYLSASVVSRERQLHS